MSGRVKTRLFGNFSGRSGQLQERLEPWVDAGISGLLASGLLQFVWIWRGYPVSLLVTTIICSGLAVVWTSLSRLRGRMVLMIPRLI